MHLAGVSLHPEDLLRLLWKRPPPGYGAEAALLEQKGTNIWRTRKRQKISSNSACGKVVDQMWTSKHNLVKTEKSNIFYSWSKDSESFAWKNHQNFDFLSASQASKCPLMCSRDTEMWEKTPISLHAHQQVTKCRPDPRTSKTDPRPKAANIWSPDRSGAFHWPRSVAVLGWHQ